MSEEVKAVPSKIYILPFGWVTYTVPIETVHKLRLDDARDDELALLLHGLAQLGEAQRVSTTMRLDITDVALLDISGRVK